jgi:hypothetical protein
MRRSGSPLRPVDWIGAQARATLNASGGGSFNICDWIISPLEVAAQFTNPTLMATRMKSAVYQYTGITFQAQTTASIGIIEWMGAEDVLPALCPDPTLDTDYDWIIRQVFPIPSFFAGYEGEVYLDTDHISQAKRRLETGAGLLICFSVENVAITFQSDVRCLIKE